MTPARLLREIRPAALCRSWLFVEGANEAALRAAPASGADVLIQELEDFTPSELRPRARALAPGVYAAWRAAGAVVSVRINPLDGDGIDDLREVMRGAPDIVALPKVSGPEDVIALDAAVGRFERAYGIAEGSTALLPNIESARALMQTGAIAQASPRVVACLMASEDLAADLGAPRTREGLELRYCRQRFLLECAAAGAVAVDCPYTFSDAESAERDAHFARSLGYIAKSAVDAAHVARINAAIGPDDDELRQAAKMTAAFETARLRGKGRAEVDGVQVEMPTYMSAKRLLARGEAMSAYAARQAPITLA